MKMFRRVCAFVLALATLFSLTGCVNHNWSVKSGDESVAAGVYIYYMMTAYNDAKAKLDDEKADVLTATIEGKTGREWIMEETRNYCKRHFAVEALCKERNIKLSDEDSSSIDSTLNYMIYYYGTFFEQAGISVASVREVYENSYLYADLLYSYFDGKGEYALKEEDIKKYFSENYFAYKALDVSFTYTSNNKETKYSDEEIKKRTELINQYYDEAVKADDAKIDDYNKKFQNRDLKEGEKEKDVTALTLKFVTKDSTTSYGDTFFEDLKKAKVGEFLKYEVKDKGIYLIQKCDEYSDESKQYKDTRETCIGDIAEEDYLKILNSKTETMEFVFNERALKKYSLDTLVELLTSDN